LSFCRRVHAPDDARLQAHAQHSGMHDFRRLNVWQLARELGAEIYRETASASRPELRLITSQLRRSALSIAANIAEGCGKSSRAETIRFLTETYPDARFVWIMGADSLQTFDRWEHWEEIANRVPMAVYARPGTTFRATHSVAATALGHARLPEDKAATLADAAPPAWVYLRGMMSNASSTAIRKSLARAASRV